MQVVGNEGAFGPGRGGNCSSGMDGSKTINDAISRGWVCL